MKIRFFFLSLCIILGITTFFGVKIVPTYSLDIETQTIIATENNIFQTETSTKKNIWYIGLPKNFFDGADLSHLSDTCVDFIVNKKVYHECLDVDDKDETDEYFTFPVITLPTQTIAFQLAKYQHENNLPSLDALKKIKLYSMNTLPVGKKLVFSYQSAYADTQVISRAQWGADETLRYTDNPRQYPLYKQNLEYFARPKTNAELAQIKKNEVIANFLKKNGENEFQTTSLTRTENGHRLVWPIQKVNKIDKIVIHHTAQKLDGTLSDEQLIRAVYVYHAVSRGWGDIGYNYIIGQNGKIYEGRAGGDYVVGAHALYNNVGSVGISVLGDYQSHVLRDTQENGLKNAIEMVAKKYGITLSNTVTAYRKCLKPGCYPLQKIRVKALSGHRDVGHTSCPGDYIHKFLPQYIRELDKQYYPVLNPHKGIIEPKPQEENNNLMPDSIVNYQKNKDKNLIPNISNNTIPSNFITTTLLSAAPTLHPISSNNGNQSLSETQKKSINISEKKVQNISENKIKNIEKLPQESQKIAKNSTENNNENILTTTRYFGKKFRVRLSYPQNQQSITLSAYKDLRGFAYLDYRRKPIYPGTSLVLSPLGDKKLSLKIGDFSYTLTNFSFSAPVVEIDSWNRVPLWDKVGKYNDNLFRDTIEIFNDNGKLTVVNHLPLEYYLKGLGEVSNTDHSEKIKTITVAARGYATFYMDRKNRKYNTMRYDGNDDPDSFQKYLGYSYEIRSPFVAKMVDLTNGEILYYNSEIIKPWYFSVSNGRTLSYKNYCGKRAIEPVCSDVPYLQSVDDPAGVGKDLYGHGVGISGIGASYFAQKGWDYKKIIQYYLSGVTIHN